VRLERFAHVRGLSVGGARAFFGLGDIGFHVADQPTEEEEHHGEGALPEMVKVEQSGELPMVRPSTDDLRVKAWLSDGRRIDM
jgi:hypothetical protein